jgi:hypothetical protein
VTTFDMSDVNKLAYDLGKSPAAVVPALGVAVAEAAVTIRDDLRSKAAGHARFPAFPRAITHDVRGLAAEIGPDKNLRAGALGNILYFGTAKTGPVLESPAAALERAAPAFEAAVGVISSAALARAIR